MISFSGYAKSPGAGEYFWMSVSMYAYRVTEIKII